MLSVYYKLWVDAIVLEKNKKGRGASWKAFTIIPISILMGFNLLTLLYWTSRLTHHQLPVILIVGIFNSRLLNIYISAILMFFIPFLLLNYLVIFYGNRYQELVKLYQNNNGKWYRNYALISIGLLIIPVILSAMF
ncbi:MAG TPA: hypothetical protein VGM63_16535 [Mucilaginibacter sp.]|jgi:hypothetical protein